MRKLILAAAVLGLAGALAPASAAEIEVKMLNKGAAGAMVFEPAFVRANVGDTIKFVATDKGHNVESIEGMLPEGVKPFVGKFNEEIVLKAEKPGVYGYKCKPHYGMGMVGMIAVGEAPNAEQAAAVSHPGKAKQVFADLFKTLATNKTASAQ